MPEVEPSEQLCEESLEGPVDGSPLTELPEPENLADAAADTTVQASSEVAVNHRLHDPDRAAEGTRIPGPEDESQADSAGSSHVRDSLHEEANLQADPSAEVDQGGQNEGGEDKATRLPPATHS